MSRRLPGCIVLGLLSVNSQAALFDRGNGMIYDNVLDVTWLQDANYANTSGYVTAGGRAVSANAGRMTWDEATTWAAQLNYGGFNDWRLPGVKPINGVNFQIAVSFNGSTDFGEHITSPQSEMSYMYYVNLQNASVHDTSGRYIGCGSTGACLQNTGLFQNFLPDNYWTGTSRDATFAWSFNAQHGIQTPFDGKANLFHAWALRSGDVAAVPLPGAFGLLCSALMALRRLRASQGESYICSSKQGGFGCAANS